MEKAFRLGPDDVSDPVSDKDQFWLGYDLRGGVFDAYNSNHDIEEHLRKAGVVTLDEVTDTEFAVFYIYWDTREAGNLFVERFNEYVTWLEGVDLAVVYKQSKGQRELDYIKDTIADVYGGLVPPWLLARLDAIEEKSAINDTLATMSELLKGSNEAFSEGRATDAGILLQSAFVAGTMSTLRLVDAYYTLTLAMSDPAKGEDEEG